MYQNFKNLNGTTTFKDLRNDNHEEKEMTIMILKSINADNIRGV